MLLGTWCSKVALPSFQATTRVLLFILTEVALARKYDGHVYNNLGKKHLRRRCLKEKLNKIQNLEMGA